MVAAQVQPTVVLVIWAVIAEEMVVGTVVAVKI